MNVTATPWAGVTAVIEPDAPAFAAANRSADGDTTTALTVSSTAVLVTVPALFWITTRYMLPLSVPGVLGIVSVGVVDPVYVALSVRKVHPAPAFVDTCHR